MEKRIKEIIVHGNSRNIKDLRKCVGSIDINDVLQIISKYMNETQFPTALMYIFDGLSDSGQAQMARLKITEKVLEEFQKCDIALVRAMDITSRLMHELPNFSTNHLIKIADLCVDCICNQNNKSKNSSHLCWKELLPTILCLLLKRVKVTQNNTQMTGEEYKSQVVKTICQAKWSCDVAVSLAGMFANISLSSEEHQQIVNKLCSYIEDLSPQELPPLAHEMLELCHERHVMPFIMRLNFYFHSRLYRNVSKKVESLRPGTQLMQFDTEEISVHSAKEVREAESTVLSYIRKSASQHPSIGELVNVMKKLSCRSPEYVLQPFLIGMLFSIGTLRTYEDQVFQILKSALQRCLVEEQMKKESAWMRGLNVETLNLESLITFIIEGSKAGQPDAEEGLVNLAFILLQYKLVPNQENLAESLWGYGSTIVVQLCKRQRHVTGSILQRLNDLILTGNSVLQYTRCLGELCAKLRLVVLEKQSLIIDLLNNLFFFPPSVARNIIVAVMPIVLLAPSVCNNLILTLRKAAYSRDVNTRKMSVYGFLEMLKNFKIESTSANHLSQGSGESAYSGYTIMSQVAVEIHSQAPRSTANSKEAVCLEVLNALRGFLSMQAEVKACLFEGLIGAVRANPGLTGPVMSWLQRHLSKQCDLDNLPPLHFEDSVALKGNEAVLQEPLALLVHLAQEVSTMALKMDDVNECEQLSVLQGILDKLVTRMARCSCENFGIEVDANLSDSDPETKKFAEVFRQALGVYEALMNYLFASWSLESQEPAEKVLALFKCHTGLVEIAKSNTKLGKKELDATAKSQAKKAAGRPSKSSSFKLPPSILGLSFLKRTLAVLYNDSVPWSTSAAANSLKGKLDFHMYILNVLTQFVGNLHSEVAQTGNLNVLYQCTVLCRVLYPKIAISINEIDAFSRQVTVQLLESFIEMFKIVVTYFKKKLPAFIQDISGVDEFEGIGEQLSSFLTTMHSMLQDVLSEEEKSESIDTRLAELLIEALTVVSLQLPPAGEQCAKVTEWIREIATHCEFSNKPVVKGVMNLLVTLTARTRTESSVLPNVIIKLKEELTILPDLEEDEPPAAAVSYPIVSSATKEIVLQCVCNTLRARLEEVEWVTSRATAELTMLDYQPGDTAYGICFDRLKDIERDLVCHLGQCVRCCVSLSACKPPDGTLTNVLLRLYAEVYTAVTLVAKYFKSRCSQDHRAFETVRFDKVVKIVGKGFTKHVFEFISYIGEKHDKSLKKAAETTKQKKILRETRYIPIAVRKKEEFDQSIIMLAKQCKTPYLNDLIRYNVARDFNIKAEKLEKALEKSDDHSMDTTRDGNESGDEARIDAVENEAGRSSAISSPATRDEDEEEEEEGKVGSDRDSSSFSEEDEVKPPSKKKRLSRVY